MSGDLNGLSGFTLGDAVFVAEVWSGQREFSWAAQASEFPYNVCNAGARRLRDSGSALAAAEARAEKEAGGRRKAERALQAAEVKIAQLEQRLKEKLRK